MTNIEFKQLTEDYLNTEQEYTQYVGRFFTTLVNGIETKRATKSLNSEELRNIRILREKADKTHKNWLEVARNEVLVD